jgi:hypothetical protein
VQDLEDRPADRVVARYALHAGLALSIPRLNAVLAVDDVQPDGKRVDDPFDEAPLLVVLLRPQGDLDLQLMRALGMLEPRYEHVGDGAQCEVVLGVEASRHAKRDRTESLLVAGHEGPNDKPVALRDAAREQRAHVIGARRRVCGCGEPVEASGRERPEHALIGGQRGSRGVHHELELVPLRLGDREACRNGRDAREAAERGSVLVGRARGVGRGSQASSL